MNHFFFFFFLTGNHWFLRKKLIENEFFDLPGNDFFVNSTDICGNVSTVENWLMIRVFSDKN